MASKTLLIVFLVSGLVALSNGYSGGAPVDVCEDMTPKHPAAPQKSKMPYKVLVNSEAVSAGGVAKITISGKGGFKGFLVQVRRNGDPVGKFLVADDDKFVKTISCGKGAQNAATHKNSENKNNLSLNWQAPAGLKDQVQVYVTVAQDGGTYWVHQPTALIKVN